MLTIRPHVTRKHVVVLTAVLIAVAAILPFTREYRPLGERMAQRYAENQDRAAAEVKAKEAQTTADQQRRAEVAHQQAATEARARDEARAGIDRQRSAEEDARQAANGFEADAAAFRHIVRTRRPPVVATVANADKALSQLVTLAKQPDFYATSGIRPEEVGGRACTDPAGTMDILNRDDRRARNIMACSLYMATHRAENPGPAPQIMAALTHRLADDQAAGLFPLQTLVSYVWLRHLTAAAVAGQPPGPFPELSSGETFNPALLRDAIPASFARRLIETGTTEEKIVLATHAYPDLRRLADLGARLARACQAMKRVPCLTPN